ncbi:hypothetical protein GCM10027451_51370 [Geodermatophilus aquaeductus]
MTEISTGSAGATSAAPSAGASESCTGAGGAEDEALDEADDADEDPPSLPVHPLSRASAPSVTSAAVRRTLVVPSSPHSGPDRGHGCIPTSVHAEHGTGPSAARGPPGGTLPTAGIVLPRNPVRRETRAISSIGRAADS